MHVTFPSNSSMIHSMDQYIGPSNLSLISLVIIVGAQLIYQGSGNHNMMVTTRFVNGHGAFAAPEALIEDSTITMEFLAVQRPSSHPHILASTRSTPRWSFGNRRRR
jgi:hypothetical protein